MSSPPALREYVKATIRAEKARCGLTFAQLSTALKAYGVNQSATNLSTKVARGGMSAPLFLAILAVLGKTSIEFGELAPKKAGKSAVAKKRS